MSRPARLALAVVIAAAASAALVLALIALVRSMGPGRPVHRGEPLLDVPAERVVSLTLSTPAGEGRCVREGARWTRVDSGSRRDAGEAASRLLDALGRLRRRATLGAPGAEREPLRSFGLDPPRARVQLGLVDGGALQVAIGDSTGPDGAAFALSPGGDVVLVASDAAAEAVRAVDRLVATAAAPQANGPTPPRG
jgi:hypothetical protein